MQNSGLSPMKYVADFRYDFAKDGGAVGDIELGPYLPVNAIITSGMIHVETAATSGGSATVALKVNTAEDVLAATAVGSLTLNALLDVVPVGTAATAIRTTALKKLTMSIAVASLTAGKIRVILEYYLG
jgi:hypothetical protein